MRSQGHWRRVFPYLVAAGLVVAATLIRALLGPWLGDELPYITYFAAIVAAAWFGRLGPSVLAVALSCLAAVWFFIPPRHSLRISLQNVGDWLGLIVFLLMGAILAALSESLHRARQLAVTRREWLQVTLKSIGDAVIATDHQGMILMMNSSLKRSPAGRRTRPPAGR
jgi:K+-sensing histidine kinase KdpD